LLYALPQIQIALDYQEKTIESEAGINLIAFNCFKKQRTPKYPLLS
jgi:hypothetical protein